MKNILRSAFLVCMVLVVLGPKTVEAQNQQSAAAPATTSSQANATDVDTVEHIVSAVYEAISGAAGPRNWDRFRSLFYADARLIPSRRDDNGKVTANSLSVEQYITRAQARFDKEGFFEAAATNRTEMWDHIAHVWSTYESRHAKGEKPFARGINSFQLINDGSRWWIVTIYWEAEDPGHPIPEKYLDK